MEKKQVPLLLENDVITGFSYSFTSALLNALKQAYNDETLFGDCDPGDDDTFAVPEHFIPVIEYLYEQLTIGGKDTTMVTKKQIQELVQTAEKFLAIFEKK